ncbi:hypothetical protein NQ315_007993 [Exocentrus adspersus]|uniref:Uncharacterized protein n=1 Tax=Exocentrus adspersus TaxID=1586481 RepID=A0AAV8VG24_9CUCU|nr:hypothetical protein NQ315_007993 [Exocentrus adspersus]
MGLTTILYKQCSFLRPIPQYFPQMQWHEGDALFVTNVESVVKNHPCLKNILELILMIDHMLAAIVILGM